MLCENCRHKKKRPKTGNTRTERRGPSVAPSPHIQGKHWLQVFPLYRSSVHTNTDKLGASTRRGLSPPCRREPGCRDAAPDPLSAGPGPASSLARAAGGLPTGRRLPPRPPPPGGQGSGALPQGLQRTEPRAPPEGTRSPRRDRGAHLIARHPKRCTPCPRREEGSVALRSYLAQCGPAGRAPRAPGPGPRPAPSQRPCPPQSLGHQVCAPNPGVALGTSSLPPRVSGNLPEGSVPDGSAEGRAGSQRRVVEGSPPACPAGRASLRAQTPVAAATCPAASWECAAALRPAWALITRGGRGRGGGDALGRLGRCGGGGQPARGRGGRSREGGRSLLGRGVKPSPGRLQPLCGASLLPFALCTPPLSFRGAERLSVKPWTLPCTWRGHSGWVGVSETPRRGRDPVALMTFIMCTRHYFQNLLSTQTETVPIKQLCIPPLQALTTTILLLSPFFT